MPRPALTDEQRREVRRKIRRAAAELYAKNGLAAISARMIAQEAGVSVGTLYSYFANLTELMQSLWKEPVIKLLDELETALTDVNEPIDKLRMLLESYAKFATEQRSVYRGAFLYVRPESHDQPKQVERDSDRLFCLFRNSLVEAQQKAQIRDGDPNTMTQTLLSGMHGAIALPLNLDRVAYDPPEVASQHMIDALLEWLKV